MRGRELFGIEYLSETVKTPAFPIRGRIVGRHGRLLANLLVRSNKRKPINVVFVVDTGAGGVLLSFETLRALFPSVPPEELDTRLHLYVHSDKQTECNQSHNQAEGINILGFKYLKNLDLSIVFDYKNDEFQLISVPFVRPDHNIDNSE